jgi:peptidoglycan/LPS O-acetylase OafA/YrhL
MAKGTVRPLGHVRPLDGLRAIAVLLVLGFHAGLPGFHGARAGVDVFFVLSGFLITSLLLDEHRRTGAIRLGAFYMRRALRLYPALVVAVAGALTLALLKMPVFGADASTFLNTLRGTPLALFYTTNIGRATGWSPGGFLGHTWSLAIEEQFYLVWPVVVILILRRRGPTRLGWIALACAITSAALRALLGGAGFSAEMLYNATFSHVDGIFAGCAFAVLWSERPDLVRRVARPSLTAAAFAVAGAVMVSGQRMNAAGYLLVVVATLIVLAGVVSRPASRLSAALSRPGVVAIGRRSYGIYLYHWPIFLFLGIDTRPYMLALGFGLSFGAAWVSFAVVEGPFLAMKRRWTAAPPNPETITLRSRSTCSRRAELSAVSVGQRWKACQEESCGSSSACR